MSGTAFPRIDRSDPARWCPPRVLALAAGVLMAGCGPPDRAVDLPMPMVSTGEAVMHAVRDEQLREVMRHLGGVVPDRLPQELDDPSRERAYLQDLSSHARDLAHDADRVGAIVDSIGLTTDQQHVFLGLAERLRNAALRLRAQADLRQTRLLETTMQEIDDTCAACHTLFRVPPETPPATP